MVILERQKELLKVYYCWFVSAFVPPPFRFVFWILGLIIDISTPTLFTLRMSVRFAPNIHHLPERFGSFTIIVLGISILGVVDGISSHKWTVESITDAALGMGIAFSLWWIYFDSVDGAEIRAPEYYGSVVRLGIDIQTLEYFASKKIMMTNSDNNNNAHEDLNLEVQKHERKSRGRISEAYRSKEAAARQECNYPYNSICKTISVISTGPNESKLAKIQTI